MRHKIHMLLLLLIISWGFNAYAIAVQSDSTTAIAQQVVQNMGGSKEWNNTRFIAWSYNNQYQVWDKREHRYRLEERNMVAVIDLVTKGGKTYKDGQEVQDPEEALRLKELAYRSWVNNSLWLVLPFKLQEEGVRLKYLGQDKTMDNSDAFVLEMTSDSVNLTPDCKYMVWIDKELGLVTQWAFFKHYTDTSPVFTRRWTNYRNYGSIKLASDRSNPQSDFEVFHIAVPTYIPDAVFDSPTPIDKF
ncbi:hypothetical protein ACFSKU_06925 [Pontibacter silvestris]|uniref:Outer membrane lipoprotein-sorting protein n=1 Tax=Pontibacter silvestris TaxID=2305183 RepID=A0ABW4WXK4_9BACT|nr:hypothetical protein [Pontibacter silvestris]MCC9136522.1 hypothetical protein [Pontibacter silvestris]